MIISDRESFVAPKSLGDHSVDEIGDWLARLGLECYSSDLKKWGASGSKLLDMTQSQIEKELDMKHSLHRKKLLYAIECERSSSVGYLGSEKVNKVKKSMLEIKWNQ